MISNDILAEICHWAGLVALVVFGGTFIYLYKRARKNKIINFDFVKENLRLMILSSAFLVCSFIFFTIELFFNSTNVNYINEVLETEVDLWHWILIFFGAFLTADSLFAFLAFFVFYFFFEESYKEIKNVGWKLLALLGIFLVCLFIYTQGLAPYIIYPLPNRIYIGLQGVRLCTVGTGNDWLSEPKYGLTIALYALCILTGAVMALIICSRKLKIKYGSNSLLTNLFIIAFPSGIIGCRIWYVVGNWELDGYNLNPGKIFAVWDGGLAIMGASLGILVGVIYLYYAIYKSKKPPYNKMKILEIVDMAVPLILLSQCIGRWGNFFNTEVHGNAFAIEGFWWLPSIIKNNMHYSSSHNNLGSDQIYSPFFLIEGITNIIGCIFISKFLIGFVQKQDNKILQNIVPHGAAFSYYLIWYGATRAIMEPLRYSAYNMGNTGSWSVVSAYVMIGIGVLFIGIFDIIQYLINKKKEGVSNNAN